MADEVLDDVGPVQAIYAVGSSHTHLTLNDIVVNILRDNISSSEFFNTTDCFKNTVSFDKVRIEICIDQLNHGVSVLVALGMEVKEFVNQLVLRDEATLFTH